jgi:hypothetical protein
MSEPIIHDLDVLRPPAEYVLLAGKQIDISFVPSGIALDIMGLQKELKNLTDSSEKLKKIEKGGDEARRSFEIAAELCASIISTQHPEMTKEWLLKNTDANQIKVLMDCITNAVFRSLETGDEDTKKS